jgi:small-conductance mechanosensitive channel
MERFADVVSVIFSWVVLLFFIIAATETLGLPVLTTWLSGIALYLPRILLAALIVLAGFVGGAVLRELVTAGAASAHIAQSSFLGTLAQFTVIVISLLIAISEIGIDITLLTNIVTLIIAALLLSAAVGFALGAQVTIGNIIASYYVQKQYKAGQIVAIDEIEGKIIEITPTAVIIEARQGTVSVPAKQFIEKSSSKIADGKE